MNAQYTDKICRVIGLLKQYGPNHAYHNKKHGFEVWNAARQYAISENVNEYEKFILETATLLHDAVFIIGRKDNEEASCEFAKAYLPKEGYAQEDIEEVCKTIMPTKMPQNPSNLLQRIICDADLDNLGRKDFFQKGYALMQENGWISNKQTYELQYNFLKNHSYWTLSAKNARDAGKQENLKILERIIRGYQE
jgi:uncharacterized protein